MNEDKQPNRNIVEMTMDEFKGYIGDLNLQIYSLRKSLAKLVEENNRLRGELLLKNKETGNG